MSIKSVKEQFDKIAPDLKIIEFDEPTATVEQAAKAHNVEPGQIVKTIALALDKPILLMTAGDVKIDNKKYKDFFKKKAKMLSADDTLTFTTHPIGGVCPFGLPVKIDIFADKSLVAYDLGIPAAGSRNCSGKTQRSRLVEMPKAVIVQVTNTK